MRNWANKTMELPTDYNKLNQKKKKLVRELYIEQQDGMCSHCGNTLDGEAHKDVKILPVNKTLFPRGFFNNNNHLHHDHKTGMTIGVVHAYCNAVLWQYHGE